MFSRHSKRELLQITLPLVCMASGCFLIQGYPFYYRADFVIEPNNKVHMVYVNNHSEVVYHMERTNGQWHREDIVTIEKSYPHQIQESFSSENGFCVYSIGLRYCKGLDGVWTSTERKLQWSAGEAWGRPILLADNRHRIAIVSPYNTGVPFSASFFDQYKEYAFTLGDEETGKKTPYLTPLPLNLFMPYVSNGFKSAGLEILPFYDQGEWDGVRFISMLMGYQSGSPLFSLFLVSHSQGAWTIEKLGELTNDSTLNYLSFKGKRITAIGRSHMIKRGDNEKVTMEPFPPAYAKIFSNRLSGASSSNAGGFPPTIVDLEGKVHAFVNESEGDWALFQPRMYYHLYNPDAVSPEIPEIRELIDAREINRGGIKQSWRG